MRQWIKVDRVPSVLRHTWDDYTDAVMTAVGPGNVIEFNKRTDCILIFYGGRKLCHCGTFEVMEFGQTPSEDFDPTPFGA